MSTTLGFNNKGIGFIILASFLYATYGLWSKLLGANFPIWFQAWTRSILILLIIIPIGIIFHLFKKIEKKDIVWFATITIAATFTLAPFYYAFNYLTVGTTLLLTYGSIIISSYFIGKIFFHEIIGRIKIAACVIALLGILLISSNIKLSLLLPILGAIISGIASAAEISFTKKVSHSYSTIQILATTYTVILITNFFFSAITHEHFVTFTLNIDWLYQFFYTISAIGALYFVVIGYKYVEPSIGGLTSLSEIVFGVILGFIFFHQTITLILVIGGICIITAIALPDGIKIYQEHTKRQSPLLDNA